MMVLHDYLSKRIALLQERVHLAWMYTRVNDTTRLEHSDTSDSDAGALAMTLLKLSPDLSSEGFTTHPEHCLLICMNQDARSLLLKAMPTLNNIDIATRQRGTESRGAQILGIDATSGRRGTDTSAGSSKRKGKSAPSVGSGDEVSSNDDIPLQRWRSLL
jgi:hypothetical protein